MKLDKNIEILKRKPIGFWNEDLIVEEIKMIIEEIGDFPTQVKLKGMNRSDLSNAISKNGGSRYFRKIMGFEIHNKNYGYWNDKTIYNELEEIIKTLGHYPTKKELIDMKKGDLAAAINRKGKGIKFRLLFKRKLFIQDSLNGI